MGSSSSTHVRNISANDLKSEGLNESYVPKKTERDRKVSSASKRRPKVDKKTQDEVLPFEMQADSNDVSNIQNKSEEVEHLENQLKLERQQFSELEGQNLELQDYIENLESQLEAVDRENESKLNKPENFSESLKIKEQLILKLEKEIESTNAEMAKLKIKFKKKVRALNTKLAEEKNESSVRVMETQDQIESLKEENARLRAQNPDALDTVRNSKVSADPAFITNSESHTSIILELSSKVSEQDARITQLENQLHEKNKLIENLEKSLKTSCPAPEPVLRAETTVHEDPMDTAWLRENQVKKSATAINTRLNLNTETDWYGKKTFEQISRQNNVAQPKTATTSSRSYPGRERIAEQDESENSTKSELQAIAEEMKKLRKKKGRTKRSGATIERAPANLDNGELSGRDSGLSVDSQFYSPQHANQTQRKQARIGSGVSQCSSTYSLDSTGAEHFKGEQKSSTKNSATRPPSGGVRYDADVSHCDTDLGLSDSSENAEGETKDNGFARSDCSSVTGLDRSNIRQISAPRTKKRKGGLLKTLVKKDSDQSRTNSVETSDSKRKPPIYRVKPRENDMGDIDDLINTLDDDLLLHTKTNTAKMNLTAVS